MKRPEATVVDIDESTERWTELKLSDGSILRTKIVVVSAARIDNQHDSDRNPIYVINSHTIVTVVDSPENLQARVQ